MGKEILVTEGHTGIGLNPEYVLEIDWDHVKEDYIPENEVEDFLAHFHIKNCYEFEEWVSSMQEQYDRHIMTAVKKKLKEANTQKNMGQIQKYGNMLIRQDPYMKTFTMRLWRSTRQAETIIWPSSFIMTWRRLWPRIWE